ncbi:T-complex protein 1 subunit epsilon [Fusarium oxysporum f. sp. albedinis]|nr:T-complex protein 1 subunit epsilon [Fusarium oxysporum f. sp. albedinis]
MRVSRGFYGGHWITCKCSQLSATLPSILRWCSGIEGPFILKHGPLDVLFLNNLANQDPNSSRLNNSSSERSILSKTLQPCHPRRTPDNTVSITVEESGNTDSPCHVLHCSALHDEAAPSAVCITILKFKGLHATL